MRPCLLLTGSRGAPADILIPKGTPAVRVQERALPLRLIHEYRAAFPILHRVLAIGGGTVMDAAKALLSLQNADWATQLELIPTTFGTGAEVTRFASVYADDGRKCSLLLPGNTQVKVCYRPRLLHSLPDLEKRAGFCDAFSHCFESLWSIQATPESRAYAGEGLRLAWTLYRDWNNDRESHWQDLQTLGRLAGEAIAISKTTAAHALSYEWTQRWGIPHGFSVIVALPALCRLVPQHPALEIQVRLWQLIRDLIPADVCARLAQALQSGRRQKPCPDRLGNFPAAIDERTLSRVDSETNAGLMLILEQQLGAGHSMGCAPPAKPMDFPGP